MKEELEKIKEMNAMLEAYLNNLIKKHKTYDREVVFNAMIIKKTIDILACLEFALKNSIISVQISLIRLLCDNCLAIESATELGVNEVVDLINDNQRVSNIMIDEEQNMSDGYLKRLVSEKYPGFDRLYKFACDGVHFSKQAISSAFKEESGKLVLNVTVGNKEYKDELIANNQNALTVCKIIIDMLRKLNSKQNKTRVRAK